MAMETVMPTNSPKVSVVIPTYNRANLITTALDSVLAQSYRPIEIIVVDDGSTDNTASIIQDWAQSNSRNAQTNTKDHWSLTQTVSLIYITQTNAGGNPARNRGISQASGDYIAFLDSDDAWLTEKLSKQVPKFENPSCGAVYCGIQNMNFETGTVLEPTNRSYLQGDLREEMLVCDITAPTSAYIVRKTVFNEVGIFDTDLQARQDWDMWIRLAQKYEIECVPEPLVYFREHEGERTASNPFKEINGYRMIRKKYADQIASLPFHFRLRARSTYLKRMSRVHFKHNISKLKGLTYGIGAILSWPFDFDAYAAFGGMLMPKKLRQSIHSAWNRIFGSTPFAIRSH